MFTDLLSLISPEVNPRRAFDDAWGIQAFDRHFTFRAFHDSARYSAERLRQAGLSSVEVLEAPADGTSVFGDWRMPLAWDVDEAHFDLIGHNGVAQRIADRAQVPQCLAMWSGPTPPEGVEAEIVHIPNAADTKTYSPDSVRGKIVFTSSHPHQIKRLLADMGAAGILSDYLHASARGLDATAWINSFSDDPGGWALLAGDTQGWAFMIPPSLGERIRQEMVGAHGDAPLRGRALVRSRLYEGTLPAVTGVIPGCGKEEVILIGHQFEGGAIDNAGGVAIMIEAVRVLQQLISQGKLPPPQRSIRVLFISECYSNLYFWEKTRRHRRTVAGICLDSPVGDPEFALRPTEIHTNPHSNMSYVDALAVQLAREVMAAEPLYAWREVGFSPGTDSFIADTCFGIPCPWIGGHSRTWHTSADVPDMLPVPVMGLMAQIAAAYAYLAASADGQQAADFAHLAAARGKQALSSAAIAELGRASADPDDSMLHLAYLADRHAEAVASVLGLLPASARASLRPLVRSLQKGLRRLGRDEAVAVARRVGRPGHRPAAPALDAALAAIVPRRLVLGPLTYDRLTPEQRGGRPSPRWSDALFYVLSWCNGKRSLAEACYLAAREMRQDKTASPDEIAKRIAPSAGSMLDYFEFLKQQGYVTW